MIALAPSTYGVGMCANYEGLSSVCPCATDDPFHTFQVASLLGGDKPLRRGKNVAGPPGTTTTWKRFVEVDEQTTPSVKTVKTEPAPISPFVCRGCGTNNGVGFLSDVNSRFFKGGFRFSNGGVGDSSRTEDESLSNMFKIVFRVPSHLDSVSGNGGPDSPSETGRGDPSSTSSSHQSSASAMRASGFWGDHLKIPFSFWKWRSRSADGNLSSSVVGYQSHFRKIVSGSHLKKSVSVEEDQGPVHDCPTKRRSSEPLSSIVPVGGCSKSNDDDVRSSSVWKRLLHRPEASKVE